MIKVEVNVEISFEVLKNLLDWNISHPSCRRAGGAGMIDGLKKLKLSQKHCRSPS